MSGKEELLTEAEHEVVELLGKAWNAFIQGVVREDGPTAEHDRAEFLTHIHDAQHAIMAQAAGRAYPNRYRLIGEVIENPDPT